MPNKQSSAIILAPYLGVHKDVTQEISNGKTTTASDKFQVKPIIESLRSLNYKASAISLNKNYQLRDINELNRPDICFISKLRSYGTKNPDEYAMFHQSCVLNLKRKGTKIATLYSDHLAPEDSPDGELYRNLLFLSDAIISPSSILIGHAKQWSRQNTLTAIIKDPCLIPKQPFNRLSLNDACKVLWFGSNSNIKYLRSTLSPLLMNSPGERRFQFTFLAAADGLTEIKTILSKINISSNWGFRLIKWKHNEQPKQLTDELGEAHITFIPSDPFDPRKSGVSHNRLTDSIQSGCIAVASPMDSYRELSKVSLIGDNLSQLFNKAVTEHGRLCKKYNSLRAAYLQPFQPENNQENWARAIKSIRSIEHSF